MKQMKPCKAWALVDGDGHVDLSVIGTDRKWVRGFVVLASERHLRVRIIDDAAVERAIAAMRRIAEGSLTGVADCYDAIRDLGGKV